MPKLMPGDRQKAKVKAQELLEECIAETPKGLTYEDLQECWQNALAYWNIKKE